MSDYIFEAEEVIKQYHIGNDVMTVVDRASMKVSDGEIAVIYGNAGCGKSTFLHICAGLCSANYGRIIIRGTDILKLDIDELAGFRGIYTGMIFTKHNLIPKFTARENIVIPAIISGRAKHTYEEHYKKIINLLGVSDFENTAVSNLSEAQCQRAGAARALINRPQVLFADDPASVLDEREGEDYLNALYNTARALGLTVIYAARDLQSAIRYDRSFRMVEGFITPDLQ